MFLRKLPIRSNAGFTLIEIVIYTGITAVIITGFSLFGIAMAAAREQAEAVRGSWFECEFMLSRIADAVKAADEIELPERGESGNRLAIIKNGTRTEYFIEEGIAYEQKNGEEKSSLSSDRITVENMNFISSSPPALSPAVKIEISADYGSMRGRENIDLQTTAVVRK
jgi:hypothetical protein